MFMNPYIPSFFSLKSWFNQLTIGEIFEMKYIIIGLINLITQKAKKNFF